jgi:hypothetical protein
MKTILACLGASVLIACGDPSSTDATLIVDAPPSGDTSCVGVAGFEVTIAPVGKAEQTAQLIGPAPILDPKDCKLPRSFGIADLDIDVPVDVTITGYDGSGTAARVNGNQRIQNLRESSAHLALSPISSRNTLLVFDRKPLLGAARWADVTSMLIRKQMGSEDLLTVDRSSAGDYFDPEPGAYGIPALKPDGTGLGIGTVLVVTFILEQGGKVDARITIMQWTGTHYLAN